MEHWAAWTTLWLVTGRPRKPTTSTDSSLRWLPTWNSCLPSPDASCSGQDDLRILLGAVYGDMKGLRWREEVGDGATRVVLGDGTVGPFTLADAMVCELDTDGRIRRIRPYLRPWLALSFLASDSPQKSAATPASCSVPSGHADAPALNATSGDGPTWTRTRDLPIMSPVRACRAVSSSP